VRNKKRETIVHSANWCTRKKLLAKNRTDYSETLCYPFKFAKNLMWHSKRTKCLPEADYCTDSRHRCPVWAPASRSCSSCTAWSACSSGSPSRPPGTASPAHRSSCNIVYLCICIPSYLQQGLVSRYLVRRSQPTSYFFIIFRTEL
jgi:hypothetical protein